MEELFRALRAAGWSEAPRQLSSREMTLEQLETGLVEAVKFTPPHRPEAQFKSLKKALSIVRSMRYDA